MGLSAWWDLPILQIGHFRDLNGLSFKIGPNAKLILEILVFRLHDNKKISFTKSTHLASFKTDALGIQDTYGTLGSQYIGLIA